ncbi:MAG: hypothetical protein AB9888_12395 [Bacteroidales bacterium]
MRADVRNILSGYTESKTAEDEHPREAFYNERFPSIEEVFDGLSTNGLYSHWQILLSRKKNCALEQKYLCVSPEGFACVELIDIDYSENDGVVSFLIKYTSTGQEMLVKRSLFHRPRFLFINWADVVDLVKSETGEITKESSL